MKYLILFTSEDGTCNEWQELEGTLEEARKQATCSGRHLNYGRNGVRIVEMGVPVFQAVGEAPALTES